MKGVNDLIFTDQYYRNIRLYTHFLFHLRWPQPFIYSLYSQVQLPMLVQILSQLMMVSSFFGLIFMGLCIYSSEFTSLGNQKVLVLWYSTNTRKLSEGRLCRRKPSDGQVSHRTFGNMNLERERLEGESSHFPLLSLFFVLPFSENERHIYRPN